MSYMVKKGNNPHFSPILIRFSSQAYNVLQPETV